MRAGQRSAPAVIAWLPATGRSADPAAGIWWRRGRRVGSLLAAVAVRALAFVLMVIGAAGVVVLCAALVVVML